MSESTVRKQFLDVFLKEWELRGGDEGATRVVEREQGNGDFDAPLNAGELRLFAQGDNDLVGLLYKRLDDGWIIVPTSDFTVPATEQEILIGKRVYQLWNSFTASDEFAGQSWLVDVIPESDMKDLCEALLHVMVGDSIRDDLNDCMGLPITSTEDPRLEYERIFATGRLVLPTGVAESSERTAGIRVIDNIFDLPKDFWRKPKDFWRKTIDEVLPSYGIAAATDDDKSFMLLLKEAPSEEIVRKSYVECELPDGFTSINPTDDPCVLRFSPKNLPEEWKVPDVYVQAMNRQTLEVVAEGGTEIRRNEIVIKIKTKSDIKSAIEKADQLVLVMAKRGV